MFGGLESLPLDLKDEFLKRPSVFNEPLSKVKSIRSLLKYHYLVPTKDTNSTPIIVMDKFVHKEFMNEIANIVPGCFRFETSSYCFDRICAQYDSLDQDGREHHVRESFVIESLLNGKYFIIDTYILTYDGKNNFYFRIADNIIEQFLKNDPILFRIPQIDLSTPPYQVTSIIYVFKD